MSNPFKGRNISLASACWLVLIATIIVIVAFCHFPPASDWHEVLPLDGFYHIPMMLAGTVAILLIAFVCLKCCRGEEIRKPRLLIVSIGITIVQIVLVYSYYVNTNWDVQQVTGIAQAMANGESVEDFRGYFQWTPNNLFLSRIFAGVFYITGPLLGREISMFPLLMLQSMGACLTALMLTQTAMHIWHKKRYAITFYVFYTIIVWMSPWWSIPYSDIWGLMVAVALLWASTTLPFKRRWLKIFIIAVATVIGYYIRPQTIFVPFAVLLVKALRRIRDRQGFKKTLKPTGIALGGIATGVLLVHIAMIGCPLHLHTAKGLGPTHYLMLGANYQSIGIYSAKDVEFSRSITNKSQRQKAELKVTLDRYSALGPWGTLLQWGRKNLLNFSDGTFYWGLEGNFFREVPDRNGPVAKVTRSLFHRRDGAGKYYVGWTVAATSLWFGILIISLFAAWPMKKERLKMDDRSLRVIESILFALLMLIAFHTLCEARARYLFCFTPFFVMMAVEGLRRIEQLFLKDSEETT